MKLILSVIIATGCKGTDTPTAVESHKTCLETTAKYLDKTSPAAVPATHLVRMAESFCSSNELPAREATERGKRLDDLLRRRAMLIPPELEKQRVSDAIEAAAEAKARADRAKQAGEATKSAADARDRLEKLQRELESFDGSVAKAVGEVATAKSQAALDTAQAKLRQLQEQQHEVKELVAAAQTVAARAERSAGVLSSDECLNNPLATGC